MLLRGVVRQGETARSAFDRIDTNGDGLATVAEVQAAGVVRFSVATNKNNSAHGSTFAHESATTYCTKDPDVYETRLDMLSSHVYPSRIHVPHARRPRTLL